MLILTNAGQALIDRDPENGAMVALIIY